MPENPVPHPRWRRRTVLRGAALGIPLAVAGLPLASASAAPMPEMTRPLDLDATPDAVGMCYSVWLNMAVGVGQPIYDNTDLLAEAARTGQPPRWGPLNWWHHWGRPAGGYYRSDDRQVLDRHFQQLSDARVDFIVVDATNCSGYGGYDDLFTHPVDVLLDQMRVARGAGRRTPHVVFWVGSWANSGDASAVARFVWDRYYAGHGNDHLFATYQGKPLLLVTEVVPGQVADRFTLRKMWGLQGSLSQREWSFLQPFPQQVAYDGGVAEQITVSAALQRGYMSDAGTAIWRRGGLTLQEQWRRAFQVRPRITVLTWWNEWIAQRFQDEQGNTRFVDNYHSTASRDIEPQDPGQTEGNGDRYYRWTRQYIAAYKNHAAFPEEFTDSGGDWTVLRNRHSGKVLDVSEISQASGARVWQWHESVGGNQKWRFVDNGDGWFRLQVQHSGKVLAIAGMSRDNGAWATQWDDNGTPDHLWRRLDRGDGWFVLQNRHSGKVLAVDGMSPQDGAQVTQWDDNGTDDHLWRMG
jgi:ricin-type beta-trefoil lectin protein